jgi:hypothetical protein
MSQSQERNQERKYVVKVKKIPLWRQIERQRILNKYADNENNTDTTPTPTRGNGPLERMVAIALRKTCETLGVCYLTQ